MTTMKAIGAARRVKWAIKRRLAFGNQRKHMVFRYIHGAAPRLKMDQGVGIFLNGAPADLCDLKASNSPENFAQAENQCAAGAKLAVATIDGKYAASAFYRRVVPWFCALGEEDTVIYSVVTERSAMGRGLAGLLAQQIAIATAEKGGSAYVDCAMWNTRAHRAFEKAGFKRSGDELFEPTPNAPQAE